MTIHSRYFILLAVFILYTFSCTKPALIGSDFLEDEKALLQFQDSFALTLFTVKTDSVIVHSNNVSRQLFTYLCGDIQDPIFGRYTADIYAQPLLPGIATSLIASTLDSVVLALRYDTLGTYGTILDPVTIEVYRMLENPAFNEDYYSNGQFLTSTDLLGSLTFIPKPKDSVTINGAGTVVLAPHIRIPLDIVKMGDLLLQDSSVFENQDSFLNYFNGLYIKMSGATNTMLGFNLLSSVTGLTYYYDKGTSADLQFKFVITAGSVKAVHMEHDYTGSMVEAALAPEPEGDFAFIQGLSGVATYMRVEGLDAIGDAIINQAEIELYCTFPDGDVASLYPPSPYVITQEKTDTSIVNSEDVAIALALTGSSNTTESFNAIFGGKLGKPDPGPPVVYRYKMNVTNQIKDIFEGNQENIIYFNPFGKGNIPNRTVIFGPNHPTYAPRLRITYTVL
ncbi:MAG: DUF4270 family protein [Saprospiraceae bacterium]|nr:DUF4270 family protein [Saprospiraceae bacterium]